MTDNWTLYRDDYCMVSAHSGDRVGVWVGEPPEDARPTIVDAEELRDALDKYLEDEEHGDYSDPDETGIRSGRGNGLFGRLLGIHE